MFDGEALDRHFEPVLFYWLLFLSSHVNDPAHSTPKGWHGTHLLWLNSVLLWGKTSFRCHRKIFSLNGTTKMNLVSAYQRVRSSTRTVEVIVGVASGGKHSHHCFSSEEKNMESTCDLSKTICLAAHKTLSICVFTWAKQLPWRPLHRHGVQGHQLVDIK